MDKTNDQTNGAQLHLVTFRLDQQLYALPIEPIRQIIEMVTITPMPQVRDSVEGVINFRGAAVPVVNLRQHLGMPKTPSKLHTPIIVVSIANHLVGLLVDEVLDVHDRPAQEIVNPEEILPEGLGEVSLLQGLFQSGNDMILLLDINHLLQPQQAKALAEAVTALPGESAAPVTPDAAQEEPTSPARRKTKKKATPEATVLTQSETEPEGAAA